MDPARRVDLLPPRWARLGSLIGGLGAILWLGRRTATRNLALALGPELAERQRQRLLRDMYRHLSLNAIEAFRLTFADERSLEQAVSFEGLEHWTAAHARGRGVLILTAHRGNWDLLACVAANRGIPLSALVRRASNPAIRAACSRARRRFGVRQIPAESGAGSLSVALRTLRKGGSLAILADQRVASRQGVLVDFFGHPAWTTSALAILARRTGAPVVPAFACRRADGGHRVRVRPPIPWQPVDGSIAAEIEHNTRRYVAVVEAAIRRRPAQWLWTSRRWPRGAGLRTGRSESSANSLAPGGPPRATMAAKEPR